MQKSDDVILMRLTNIEAKNQSSDRHWANILKDVIDFFWAPFKHHSCLILSRDAFYRLKILYVQKKKAEKG